MGTPTGATVIFEDGRTQEFDAAAGQLTVPPGGLLEYRYNYSPQLIPTPADSIPSMWRYRNLLLLPDGPVRYPLPVGGTPLIAPPAMRERLGVSVLFLKDETRMPTGSNKDRATALVLEHALREGRDTVSCASTGNVAVSLAVGAAAAGKQAVIFVPAQVAESKRSLMLLAGATVVRVAEGYDAAFRLSEEAAAAFGWYSRNTGVNPLTLEAKKTVAIEIWEQLERSLPDVVVSPVGDGVTLAALAKGFRELAACGVVERVPRIVGVQAAGAAPLVDAWTRDRPWQPVVPQTVADGIAVGAPVSAPQVLRAVRETGGGMVAVSDEELLAAVGLLARDAGVLAEPAGAAATAGLTVALERGLVTKADRVVVLVTGTLLKNLQFVPQVGGSGRALDVHADLEELRAALNCEPA